MRIQTTAQILPVFGYCGYVRHERPLRCNQHKEAELIYIEQGSCSFRAGNARYELRGGHTLILAPNTPHMLKPHTRISLYTCIFNAPPAVFDSSQRCLDLESENWADRWFHELYQAGKLPLDDNRAICQGLLYALLQRIELVEKHRSRQDTLHPALKRAVRFLNRHCTRDMEVSELADVAMVSGSYLTSLFAETFECGPLQYQQHLRLEYAARLLTNRSLSVKEIAFQCGYGDANYFARLFRRRKGMSPSAWRATH